MPPRRLHSDCSKRRCVGIAKSYVAQHEPRKSQPGGAAELREGAHRQEGGEARACLLPQIPGRALCARLTIFMRSQYRLTRLPNGMLAILVHDPEIVLSEEGEDGAGERRPTDDRSMRSAPLSEARRSLRTRPRRIASCRASQIPRSSQPQAEDGESMSEEEDDDNEEDGEGSGGEGSPLGSLEGGESSEEGEAARALRTHPAGAAQGEKRAAAAVSVGIGSFSDPQDLPGLSHLLEHMLVMRACESRGP